LECFFIRKLGNYLTTLVSVGTEPGIPALSTVISTGHGQTQLPPLPQGNVIITNKEVRKPDLRVERSMSNISMVPQPVAPQYYGAKLNLARVRLPAPVPGVGGSDYYTNVAMTDLTSTMTYSSPLMRYIKNFVWPTNIGNLGQVNESTITMQQSFQIEPERISYNDSAHDTTSNDQRYVTLNQICLNAANFDIKTVLASPSEYEVELTEMTKTGGGGFFTNLAKAIGNVVGVPAIGAAASAVEKVWDI